MTSVAYSEAATEVLQILERTEIESVNKIPKKFIEFLEKNKSKTYNPKFDWTRPIKELNLKPKTEALLGIIYLKYWANEEEKIAFTKRVKENEERYQEELKEKYSAENLFKNKETAIEKQKVEEKVQLTVVHNKNFIQKIIEKIKNIFRR